MWNRNRLLGVALLLLSISATVFLITGSSTNGPDPRQPSEAALSAITTPTQNERPTPFIIKYGPTPDATQLAEMYPAARQAYILDKQPGTVIAQGVSSTTNTRSQSYVLEEVVLPSKTDVGYINGPPIIVDKFWRLTIIAGGPFEVTGALNWYVSLGGYLLPASLRIDTLTAAVFDPSRLQEGTPVGAAHAPPGLAYKGPPILSLPKSTMSPTPPSTALDGVLKLHFPGGHLPR